MDYEEEDSNLSDELQQLDKLMKSSSVRGINSKSIQPFQDIQEYSNSIQSPSQYTNSLHSKDYSKQKKVRGRGRGRRAKSIGGRSNSPLRATQKIIKQHRNQASNQQARKKMQIFMQSDQQSEKSHNQSWSSIQQNQKIKRIKNDSNSEGKDSESDRERQRKEKELYSQIQQQSHFSKQKNSIFLQSNYDQQEQEQQDYQQNDMKDQKQESNRKNLNQKLVNENNNLIQTQEYLAQKKRRQQQQKYLLNQKSNKIRKYAQNFADYKLRRIMKYVDGKIDCNTRYLHQLVYDCYSEQLICEQLMLGIKYMGLGNSLDFIQKYKQEKLSEFDFKKVKFTIFDHRRLVQLLKQKAAKKKYTDQKPLYFMPYEMHLFLTEVYALPDDAYEALCASIDEAYQLTWWKTIGTNLKGKQRIPQVKQVELVKPIARTIKTRIPPKRIRYKVKFSQKDNPQENINNKIKIEQNVKKQHQNFQKLVSNQDDKININQSNFNISQKKSKSEKQSFFSSSLFETQKLLDSQFSMSSDTHSLQNVSDLLSDFDSEEQQKKPKKDTKQILEKREMEKVQKSSVNLRNIQKNMKSGLKTKQKDPILLKLSKKQKKTLKKQGKILEQQESESSKKFTQQNKKMSSISESIISSVDSNLT